MEAIRLTDGFFLLKTFLQLLSYLFKLIFID